MATGFRREEGGGILRSWYLRVSWGGPLVSIGRSLGQRDVLIPTPGTEACPLTGGRSREDPGARNPAPAFRIPGIKRHISVYMVNKRYYDLFLGHPHRSVPGDDQGRDRWIHPPAGNPVQNADKQELFPLILALILGK